MNREVMTACPHCGQATPSDVLAETAWLPGPVREALDRAACATCAQRTLHGWLAARVAAGAAGGFPPFDHGRLVPFGVLPVTRQLGLGPPFLGRGVTVAMVDSGFYPHPDITGVDDSGEGSRVRLRAWADTSNQRIKFGYFHPFTPPRWPGWSRRAAEQWHGMMTAAVAAGDGGASHGWYRGVAPECDLVFVQTYDENRRITNASIARALRWLHKHRERLRLRIVNVSVYGDPVQRLKGNYVDAAVRRLIDDGVVVVTAVGNSGKHGLVPPATAAEAIGVGGVDFNNSPDPAAWRMWNSNWGRSAAGTVKPDLCAPSQWLPAPVLPGSKIDEEARDLFARRDSGDPTVEEQIAHHKLLSPHYQHVDGTSFSAAVVSGVVACLLEANPELTPRQVRAILMETAMPLANVPAVRQGAGVVRPAIAIEQALQPLAAREK
jgi:serine protease AprX